MKHQLSWQTAVEFLKAGRAIVAQCFTSGWRPESGLDAVQTPCECPYQADEGKAGTSRALSVCPVFMPF